MAWKAVAREIAISPESLRAIRNGRNGPSDLTARAIDDWLGWEPGSTETLFSGGEPTPRKTESPTPRADIVWRPGQGAVELTVLVYTAGPEPEFPPGGLRTQAERIIWAMTDEPWQVRLARILAGRELEAAVPEVRTTGQSE
ncbi:hypothetical protein OHR68_39815 [Spirillospora sp. NBC_00431]